MKRGESTRGPGAAAAGRAGGLSYPGWLWSYGINYQQREADIARIYQGDANAIALLHRYHADYVVVRPDEVASLHANVASCHAQFPVLLRTANYTLYRVPAA